MKKKLLIAGGVLAGVVVIGLVVVYFMLNSIVRSTVESAATTNLKVRTTLGGASVSPFSGAVGLTNLKVASPDGFTAPEMFTLGDVAVNVSYGELFGAPVKIAAIKIAKPRLVIEQANGKFNFMELMNNLKSDKPAPTPDPAPKSEPLKLVITQIDLSGAEVELRPGLPGMDQPILIPLPDLSLANIGNADGNQTGEEVGRVVTELVEAMANKAIESDRIPPAAREWLKFDAAKFKAELNTQLEQRIEKGKEKVGKEIEKGLENLLNRKEKDKDKK